MPVHQLGLPADMDGFFEVAARHGVALVEDAACAIGASHRSRPIGSLGPLACFSFHPRKVITTGEGGMIAVHDPEVADRLRRLRQHAMDVSDLARHSATDIVVESYPERGWNARMTDMQATLGLCQLELLDGVLEDRRRLAERYTAALERIPLLEPPYEPDYVTRTWQSYAVKLRPGVPLSRTELQRSLLRDGIATRRGVTAIHAERAYSDRGFLLPHTDACARDALLLPLFADLPDEQQDYVIERLATHVSAAAAA
jgi:dTDP-4-amino-4,6-dideoxygalactose transaminase